MDRLDQVLGPVRPLLARVDELLNTAGAPAGHRLWAELRRVRLLPGDAVAAVASLRPDALTESIGELRTAARSLTEVATDLPRSGDDWSGDAAEAYDDLRSRTATHLSGDPDSLDARLADSAVLAAALADWMVRARTALAAVLAEVLVSHEAVTLTAPPTSAAPFSLTEATAAADVAAHILRSIADLYADASDLLRASKPLTTAIPL